jgi:ECF transporter S component (folate family)
MRIFTKEYWKAALSEFRQLKKLILAALFCALIVVVGGLYIPVGQSLQIHFTFFIVALGASIYGPICGMMVAAAADVLNYFLFLSAYPYFPGYMLSEMLVALIFGLLLYRQTITIPRLIVGKVLMNFPINVGLGALWSQALYGKGYLFYFWQSLVKNTLLLPLEILLAAGLFAAILPATVKLGLHEPRSKAALDRLRRK